MATVLVAASSMPTRRSGRAHQSVEVRPLTLGAIERAIRLLVNRDCDPTDAAKWTPANPSLGQCAVTALVVHDLVGGELLEAEVQYADGSRQGFHYWNRLAGVDIDLYRAQFAATSTSSRRISSTGSRISLGWHTTSTSSSVTACGRNCNSPPWGTEAALLPRLRRTRSK